MKKDLYCPIIHGGLNFELRSNRDTILYQQCCIRTDYFTTQDKDLDFFNSPEINKLRKTNLKNIWDKDCANCKATESMGHDSFRTGMIKGLGTDRNLRGPTRLDLQFDIGCNLACRICGPKASSFWQKHLRENGLPVTETYKTRTDDMLHILKNLCLDDLKMVVFCGGETLLGNNYWRIVEYLAEVASDITLCFQTNGTQSIPERYFDLVEKFHLVKLHVSLDGIGEKFEYQRWPASWNQVVENLNAIRENAPVNVMFQIEETINIMNILYQFELAEWIATDFSSDRQGDQIGHSKHIARGDFAINNITSEYYDALVENNLQSFVYDNWVENPEKIKKLVQEIKRFDEIRGQDFTKTFPEVAEFYARYF